MRARGVAGRRRGGALALAAAFLVTLLGAGQAQADPSGWAQVGGGVFGWQQGQADALTVSPLMTIDMGVGTDEDASFLFGGLFRIQPVIGHGADLALMARLANQGFQAGWVGFAIDAGAYHRFWGETSTGFMGQATLGGPLGLQLSAMGSVGSGDAFGFGGTLGIDFARLTVHRRYLLDWWPNPRPSATMHAGR